MMSFLRPMGFPRHSTVRHFLRFSTSTRCNAEAQASRRQEDANLVASRTASPTYPPRSMTSLPRPKESRASRRTSHPPKPRPYPTRQPSHLQQVFDTTTTNEKLIRDPVQHLPDAQCAPNLPYYITRTPNNELPIYTLRKRGGNLKLTRVKKVDGQVEALRDALRKGLGLEDRQVVINQLTRHVIIKGHVRGAVEKFLRERKF